MSRITTCITLSPEANQRVLELVKVARTNPLLVQRLNLASPSIKTAPSQPRKLTTDEVKRLAIIMKAEAYLHTQTAVLKAIADPARDPVLTSAAINELREIYRTPPVDKRTTRAPYINVSRVIEALIMQAGAVLEAKEQSTTAGISTAGISTAGNAGQAGNEPFNTETRKAASSAAIHRASAHRRTT